MTPMGLPEGTVRAILAVVLVSSMILSPDSDAINSAAMMVLGFYFGSRRQASGKVLEKD